MSKEPIINVNTYGGYDNNRGSTADVYFATVSQQEKQKARGDGPVAAVRAFTKRVEKLAAWWPEYADLLEPVLAAMPAALVAAEEQELTERITADQARLATLRKGR